MAGEFVRENDQFVTEVKLKTHTGCMKGDILAWDTDGFAQASASSHRPFVVARKTVADPGADQQATALVAVDGVITVNKVASGTINDLQVVKIANGGKVTGYTTGDGADIVVGKALKGVVSGGTGINVILGDE